MKFVELKKRIKSGEIKPIYLLTGDDARVIDHACDILTSVVTVMPELNVTKFDESVTLSEVEVCAKSFPLMDERRVVIVRDYKATLEPMEGYFNDPLPSTVLIFIAPSLTPNFSKYVKNMEIVDCNRLPNDILIAYIEKAASSHGCQITKKAADLLINYSLGKLSVIENEMEKLCNLTDLIKEEDVKNNVNADAEYKIFELSDAIGKKQGERAMNVLQALLADGYAPSALFSMLEAHFRRLLYVSLNKDDDNLAAKLGVKEGAIRIALNTVGAYKPVALKRIYDCIAEDEYSFKSGETRDKDAIYSTVLKTLNM